MYIAEFWRPIKDFEGIYEVSDRGNVKSLARNILKSNGVTQYQETRLIKVLVNKRGRKVINLYGDDGIKTKCIARLVAEAFLPDPDKPNRRVGYIDGNPLNCSFDNLFYKHNEDRIVFVKPKSTPVYKHNPLPSTAFTFIEKNGFFLMKNKKGDLLRTISPSRIEATKREIDLKSCFK